MKTKKVEKKLSLSKQTIATLNSAEMESVNGGIIGRLIWWLLKAEEAGTASCPYEGCWDGTTSACPH